MSDWLGMLVPRRPRPEVKGRVLARVIASRDRRRFNVVGLAAAAVLVFGVTAGLLLWHRATQLRDALAATRDTLGLLRQPGTRVVVAPVTVDGRSGAVTIVVDTVSHRWLVVCHNLAPNTPDQTYQLWIVTDRGLRPAGLMPMDYDRPMLMALSMPEDSLHVTGAAMTIEPREGSSQPRGETVFRVDL